jgi:hypothetical protein
MRDMAALTPAKKQAAYRARHKAAEQSRPDAIEAALFERAARCEELSDEQRAALADEIADIAKGHLWRAHELAKLAEKVRPLGWHPPGFPP